MFDANKKSAAGYNGCNNYFGQYELQGRSLKFGPIASTRRACPEAQSEVENELMVALEKTHSWVIKDGTLILLDGTNALARFIINKTSETSP
jgi:heat shock protein HslJ